MDHGLSGVCTLVSTGNALPMWWKFINVSIGNTNKENIKSCGTAFLCDTNNSKYGEAAESSFIRLYERITSMQSYANI